MKSSLATIPPLGVRIHTVAGSANAATPDQTGPKHTHTLAQVQASSAIRTDKLVAHLGAVQVKVNANTTLTADQKSTVVAALTADVQAVQAGAAKIAADTTVKDAAKDTRNPPRSARHRVRTSQGRTRGRKGRPRSCNHNHKLAQPHCPRLRVIRIRVLALCYRGPGQRIILAGASLSQP